MVMLKSPRIGRGQVTTLSSKKGIMKLVGGIRACQKLFAEFNLNEIIKKYEFISHSKIKIFQADS